MDSQQADRIRELRIKGEGYRSIAREVGLTRDIVRNYCKSHGLDGYAEVLISNMREQIQLGKSCLRCGKELEQPHTGRKKKFCSDRCRREWWKEHPERITRRETAYYKSVCVYCGREFKTYGNKDRRYCSHNCYVRDRFFREEEGREPYISPKEKEDE